MDGVNAETQSALPETLGRYRLLQPLGQGGMGAVFLAHDTKLDRRVAVKVLPPHTINDPDAVARFQREAKALAKLGHPGIVQAFDSDSAGDRHFLVMEYVEGETLAALLKKNGPLPPTIAADYIHQAALALQHAHEKGLIHRDIKPSNLLVTAEGRIKVLDLGLARFIQDQIADPGLTREGAGMGTPDYAAPEQLTNAHLADIRSDMYSLGCTLYHLLAGQVPFPGSSWEEKYKAHQHREPPPLAELCPTAPAGLFFAVEKMMAKRPEDRFQTAQEAAEALAPCVARSSVTFEVARQTMTYLRTQTTLRMRPARRWPWALIGAAVSCALLLVALFVWPGWWPEPPAAGDNVAQGGSQDVDGDKQGDKKKIKDGTNGKKDDEKKPPPPPVWDDPDVLTVAEDGSAKFKTINEALEKVKPGQTIRVLDAGEYRETITLSRAEAYQDITLEAVAGASLAGTSQEAFPLLQISNVAGVTVRGFQFHPKSGNRSGVEVRGSTPGLLLEDLVFDGKGQTVFGIELKSIDNMASDAAVVVRRSSFRKVVGAVAVKGQSRANPDFQPCRGIRLEANNILETRFGIPVMGHIERLQIVGNTVVGCNIAGIHFEDFAASTRQVLLANNTFLQCKDSVRLWDDAARGADIDLCNNLILANASPADVLWYHAEPKSDNASEPGDGARLGKTWRVRHNWRELAGPPEAEPWKTAWLPLGDKDKLAKSVAVLSRDVKDADYLRPAADSPLAKDGAGNDDPSLPMYVGALPPPGQPAWDWTRTWQAWPPGRLLTVSKDPKDKGKYRTINAALKDAKPWDTIRVLDQQTYPERVVLDDAKRHEGIMLEAPKRATIALAAKIPQVLLIKDVANVRIRGFQLRSDSVADFAGLTSIVGRVPGAVLEDLHLQGKGFMHGIVSTRIQLDRGEGPVVMRHCAFRSFAHGIGVIGPRKATKDLPATTGVVVHGNEFTDVLQGLHVDGETARIQATGNLFWGCQETGLEMSDPGDATRDVLIASNTAHDCGAGLRVWTNDKELPRLAGVLVFNNVFTDGATGDVVCFQTTMPGTGTSSPELAELVARQWRFGNNWRDLSGNAPLGLVPRAPGDHKVPPGPFVSREARAPDFLRPTEKLFEEMAKHPPPPGIRLPPYAGAVPPSGVEPWHWEQYWRYPRH